MEGEIQVTATVSQASPLRILIDGADTDSSAEALDGESYTLDDRVTATLRTPRIPLVQGQVETA
jgi:hypothetical protein